MTNRSLPREVSKQLATWNAIAISHRVIQVVLGMIGLTGPLALGAFADYFATWQVRVISFAAAASIAIYGAFDIGNLATRWREAWKHLNAACLDYELGIIDADKLAQAYRDGEAIIGKMKADIFSHARKGKERG